ncbi:YfhO family protein [Robertkochia solimangrovi]|uniref:YfhO family protein n=1 Tax=Robertkochia solimangrovi TaxID=2213046 RepID=UPI0011813677|nr:YfhO family protein [Robertkochia solimangrovi]TRZ45354.1 hypothetical protein DMZ48_06310 [Robertkochia solimangrovi]
MTDQLKKAVPHLLVLLLFTVISLLYFSPVLQGKQILQSDIVQYIGMSKERNDLKESTGHESYWTNSAFAGMPTYQLGANYPNNYIKKLDKSIRFLPRPADYLFLYFVGFYLLMLVLKVDWKLSLIGALAFGFSSYLIIILGVGHNAKAHAVGYFAWVLAGIILCYRKRYLAGFLLTAFAMALEINANHFQMTYYLLLLVLVLGVAYLVDAYRKKELSHFFKATGILAAAVVISIGTNATNIMATREYADWSTRGQSDLTLNPDGSLKESTSGLDKDYITTYSYGITESLNLFIPRLFGGSDQENLGKGSKTYTFLTNRGVDPAQALDFSKSLPMYWGDQPGVAGPAYVGVVIFFLFLTGLFLVKGRLKWWLLGGSVLSLLLSWGHNFSILTDLMIDYFPMYNKFRAITSIQVILELCFPVLAIVTLSKLMDTNIDKALKMQSLLYGGGILGGCIVLLFLLKGSFGFNGPHDAIYAQNYGQEFIDVIRSDRKAIYNEDLFRSLLLLAIAFGTLWFYLKDKLKVNLVLLCIGVLIVYDLAGVDRRYVNGDDFVSSRVYQKPFQEDFADKEITKDTGYFRVFDPQEGLNGARTSYFHNSIGGYHAAKPKRLQELFEYQVANNNMAVLNMLNVRYIKTKNDKGQVYPARNPYAFGNAWFVDRLIKAPNADAGMQLMDSVDLSSSAILNTAAFPDLAGLKDSYNVDSTATISLKTYEPDKLVYTSKNSNTGLAVFSEMYYPHGWKVTIDGEEATEFRVNHALRALEIPAGSHEITFTFDPDVVTSGSRIALGSTVVLFLLLIFGIYRGIGKKEDATV